MKQREASLFTKVNVFIQILYNISLVLETSSPNVQYVTTEFFLLDSIFTEHRHASTSESNSDRNIFQPSSNQVTGICMKFSSEPKCCNYDLTEKSGSKIFLRAQLYLNKCAESFSEKWE